MTALEKIVAGLKAHGIDCPPDVQIRRTRAGRHQKAAGAWLWFLWSNSSWSRNGCIGSHYTVREIARGPFTISIHNSDVSLDPEG